MNVRTAVSDDLAAILALQYLAFQSEAETLGDFSIPPLRETLEELYIQFRNGTVFLKAVDAEGQIVGSVRGVADEDTLRIGKLMVHPAHRNKGLGKRLLAHLESSFPHLRRELFTSDRSVKNLQLYESMGYLVFKAECIRPDLRLVYLEKAVSPEKQ